MSYHPNFNQKMTRENTLAKISFVNPELKGYVKIIYYDNKYIVGYTADMRKGKGVIESSAFSSYEYALRCAYAIATEK